MARRANLRASDTDREHVADRLRHATAEGRLLAEELEERLEAVFAARTYGELDAVVADLPGQEAVRRDRSRSVRHRRPIPVFALIVLIPVVAALMFAAVVVIATLLAVWAVLVTVGWWAFGHRRPYYPARVRRSLHACGRWRV